MPTEATTTNGSMTISVPIKELSFLRTAKQTLEKANTIPEIVQLRDQAETFRQYVKRIGESLELQNSAAEIKLRAERKAGELLRKTIQKGGNRRSKSHDVTLTDLGVSKMQSSRWQSIAAIPKLLFDRHIREQQQGRELTSASTLSLAKELLVINRRKQHEKVAASMPSSGSQIITGDMMLLWDRLDDDSVDLIFTDPPYGKSALCNYGNLAELAAAKLKPGGLCLVYAGQMFLPEVLSLMGAHLKYWWMFAIRFSGQHAAIHPRHIQNKWRPVIAFGKPDVKAPDEWLGDLLIGGGRAKDRDDWEQEESESEYLIRKLTKPGQLVVDPFCGSGTFCAAAKKSGRRWIGTELDPLKAKMARGRLRG